jgi:hypothetical protein
MNRTARQNLAVTGLSLIVLILVILLLRTAEDRPQSSSLQKTSSFFTDPSGTKAMYLVLREFLPSTERWMRSLYLLPPPERNNPTTLLVIGPSESLQPAEADALDGWIRQGGQLILAAQQPWRIEDGRKGDGGQTEEYLPRHGFFLTSVEDAAAGDTTVGGTATTVREYQGPTGPLLLGGGVLRAGDFTELFSDPPYIKGGEKRLGSGRILVIADRKVWSNDRLSESSNAVWLVSTVLAWDNGRLLIDEFHQGFQKSRGPVSLILSFIASFWGLVFVQLAFAGCLLLWLRARRFQAVIDLPVRRKQDPLERTESLATLLAAAKATSFALQTINQLLLRRLWQLRFGSVTARSRTPLEREIGEAAFSARYRSLVSGRDGKSGPREEELLEAAREAGKIVKEYKRGR